MGDYSMYAPEYRPGGQYGPTPPMGRDPFQPFTDNPVGLAGGTGTPPMGRNPFQPFTDNPVGVAGGVGNPMQDIFQQFTERQRQGAGGFGGPQTTMSPTVQPMAPPPAGGGLPYNDGFYNPTSAPRQPLTQPPAPMAMKKGGFAVKPVWDKKRPKDLGKPKDLSAKKEKSAKARAKAAGRPYPNLIDNMAVARKKGK
jgi:hypothetical protein